MAIFGFKVSPQLALIMMLAGLGVLFYGIYVVFMQYEYIIDPEMWLDWQFVFYILVHFLAIGLGAYLTIAGILSRKGK